MTTTSSVTSCAATFTTLSAVSVVTRLSLPSITSRSFIALIYAQKEEIDRRRSVGVGVSPLDYYSGVALEPGYRRHMARQRLVYKAIGRGVNLPEATLERVDWHPDIGFFWSVKNEHGSRAKER